MWHSVQINLVNSHIDVGRKNRQKQQEQAPGGRPSCCGDEQPNSAQNFRRPRYVDEAYLYGQGVGHDLYEWFGLSEVQQADAHEPKADRDSQGFFCEI